MSGGGGAGGGHFVGTGANLRRVRGPTIQEMYAPEWLEQAKSGIDTEVYERLVEGRRRMSAAEAACLSAILTLIVSSFVFWIIWENT